MSFAFLLSPPHHPVFSPITRHAGTFIGPSTKFSSSLFPSSASTQTRRLKHRQRRHHLHHLSASYNKTDPALSPHTSPSSGSAVPQSSTNDNADDAHTGPPRAYDRQKLQQYWSVRAGELNQRYLAFAARAAPFVANALRYVAAGKLGDDDVVAQLAVQAREGMEALGPTYVKMGQMMSIRPDVIPQAAMAELQKLQDGVATFDNAIARAVVEDELRQPIHLVFSEFSEQPIASASLAQVYRARLRENGVEVAVKVQRPDALTICSKDMYVLQRAVDFYQRIIKRWTVQNVDYNALLESFASGFYDELDFEKEARNQQAARNALLQAMGGRVYVPKVFLKYCSRRLLVSEFVYGSKLTDCKPEELRRLISVGQECFLKQLLEPGQFLHADPHGGNLLKPDPVAFSRAKASTESTAPAGDLRNDPDPDLLCRLDIEPDLILLDFGLTASVPEGDKPKLVVAIVHMANKDWAAVTEDFVALRFLPDDIDRNTVTPLLERVLSPYVIGGGGAKGYLKDGVFSASFQNLMRDLSVAAAEIPFSIPSYWPVVGRAIAILEGIALTADPEYKIVLSSYPYVTQKLLREGQSDSFRAALNAILYPRGLNGVKQQRPSPRRVAALINNALGRMAVATDTSVMLDLDALPSDENAATLTESIAFLGTDDASAIRGVLIDELVIAADLILRTVTRRLATSVQTIQSVPLPVPRLPFLPPPRLPILNPLGLIPEGIRSASIDRIAPPLTADEDIFVSDVLELAKTLTGFDIRDLASGSRSPRQLMLELRPTLQSMFTGFTAQSVKLDGVDSVNDESSHLNMELL